MGLLNFLSKKSKDKPLDSKTGSGEFMTDLPAIDGSLLEANAQLNPSSAVSTNNVPPTVTINSVPSFGSFPSSNNPNVPNPSNFVNAPRVSNFPNVPNPPNMSNAPNVSNSAFKDLSKMPPLEASGPKRSDTISVNLPSLDFSMPPSDDAVAMQETQKTMEPKIEEKTYLDVEDLKKFFPGDGWKEPDWSTFEPYTEDKIEEPKSEDFGNLPDFKEDEPVLEPSAPMIEVTRKDAPVELFIKGSEYDKVFMELEYISNALIKMDTNLTPFEDLLKSEESLYTASKEQLEYLYKKLNQTDKKLFV